MNRQPPSIAVTGTGAVSPAGWGVDALMDALARGEPIAPSQLDRPGGPALPVRRVPEAAAPVRHPRLRRASSITKFCAAAAAEALGSRRLAANRPDSCRLRIVCTMMNACVNYSNRFFAEVIDTGKSPSPILFPETVFNAPSSHLSAVFESAEANYTLVGDASAFLCGLDIAAQWLADGEADFVLVVCGEEADWLSAEGARYFDRGLIAGEGAAALVLERAQERGASDVILAAVTDAFTFEDASEAARRQAAAEAQRHLHEAIGASRCRHPVLMVDSSTGRDRGAGEWSGPRLSPGEVCGDLMGAMGGIQCAAAVESIRRGAAPAAAVSACGTNQQAIGAIFKNVT